MNLNEGILNPSKKCRFKIAAYNNAGIIRPPEQPQTKSRSEVSSGTDWGKSHIRYYTLASAGALLNYLQDRLYIYYSNNSVKFDYQTSEGYAVIDISTADRLELVASLQPNQANKYSTLFGVMNRCLTKVGARNLRSIILQPFYSVKKIEERLNCVSELISHPDLLLSIQGILPKLCHIEQLLTISTLIAQDAQSCSNRQLNFLLVLNGMIDTILPLKDVIRRLKLPFFVQFNHVLSANDFEDIRTLIRKTLCDNAYMAKGKEADARKIWAIKSGVNGFFDMVRKTYSERVEAMRVYVKSLADKYDLPLMLANNNKKGYHIVLSLNKIQKKSMRASALPEEFIQVTRMANSFTLKTPELVNFSTRIDDILTNLLTIGNMIVHKIIIKVKQFTPLFYKLVDYVAYLDVLQSLAEVSLASGWVRPEFKQYTEVSLGRHPILDFLCKTVSNSINCCEHYNHHIISGPNGSGKSIYIRQVMLLQIIAQTGCYVPAESAVFKSADQMFARISNGDDMECGASSFVLEMNEISYILNTITDDSLIIIDELCRSTSVDDGIALAMSICESFIRTKAFVYVTTHYGLLCKLADIFINTKVWQMETVTSENRSNAMSRKIDFKYKLLPGITTVLGYGIYMAKNIWPERAFKNVEYFQNKVRRSLLDPKFAVIDQKVRLKYELKCKLNKLKLSGKLSMVALKEHLQEYNELVSAISSANTENRLFLPANESFQLRHSIFDTSQNPIDNSQLSTPIFSQTPIPESVSQLSEISATAAKQRMMGIFTPDTELFLSRTSVEVPQAMPETLFESSSISHSKHTDSNNTFEVTTIGNERSSSFNENFKGMLQKYPVLTSTPINQVSTDINSNHENITDVSRPRNDLEEHLLDEDDINNKLSPNEKINESHHIFPIVTVVEGPGMNVNESSSENNIETYSNEKSSDSCMDNEETELSEETVSKSDTLVNHSSISDISVVEKSSEKDNDNVISIRKMDCSIMLNNSAHTPNNLASNKTDRDNIAGNTTAAVHYSSIFGEEDKSKHSQSPISFNSSKTSSSGNQGQREIEINSSIENRNTIEPTNSSSLEKTITNLSDASRKRNLEPEEDECSSAKAEMDLLVSGDPDQNTALQQAFSNTNSSSASNMPKRKYCPMSKLTLKQIKAEFLEQDRQIFENSASTSSGDIAKIWEQRMNRPTPRQIRQSTCVATVRKTSQGVEVIQSTQNTQKSRPKFCNVSSPSSFKSSVNMNIFSDANASTFEQFVKSDEKDYRLFDFKFDRNLNTQNSNIRSKKMFNFKQVNEVSNEYTASSVTFSFVREKADTTLTPDGFYKSNKSDIQNILNKYR
ncbi:uncharacterized protein LOC143197513 [Rhynchophorus ferrugineus]|uniref:uncharacterized protein LOC143197513 n=1 Tax=Rhynchophorus ferrugineus TaxID=354439 RepID=UPI003FCC3EFB